MSWEDAWREGRTGWDAGASPPVLRALVERDALPTGRALVPGCGSGYDVFTLAEHPARRVLGLDVAPTARARFEALRAERGIEPERARIEIADFFDFAARTEERFELAWDYTFFCAIEPARRSDWVEAMRRLITPGGELVMLLFPATDGPPGEGPPYPIPPEVVRPIVAERFELASLEPVVRSHPGREGKEQLARWRPR